LKIIADVDFLNFIGKQESQFIQSKDAWTDEVKDYMAHGVKLFGDELPWPATHDKVRLRPGEVTLWAGINGHSKSLLSGQSALWLSPHTKVLIASLEMKPRDTLTRMIRQAYGLNRVSPAEIDEFMTFKSDGMFIYDQSDSVSCDRILGMVHYAAQELGVNHVFIDSLMKCGIGTDDYNGQKDFVDRLCWAAKAENIHVHLVLHMRKGRDEAEAPGKFDVKGASEITDLVDNLFIVHRNKAKEAQIENGEIPPLDEPDALLTVAKQRHGEWEGGIKLWFHPASLQYLESPTKATMNFWQHATTHKPELNKVSVNPPSLDVGM